MSNFIFILFIVFIEFHVLQLINNNFPWISGRISWMKFRETFIMYQSICMHTKVISERSVKYECFVTTFFHQSVLYAWGKFIKRVRILDFFFSNFAQLTDIESIECKLLEEIKFNWLVKCVKFFHQVHLFTRIQCMIIMKNEQVTLNKPTVECI